MDREEGSGLLSSGHSSFMNTELRGVHCPESVHPFLAEAAACRGALWVRCWDQRGHPGALGCGPFSRPPWRDRRSGIVPACLLWSHSHAPQEAGLWSVSPRLLTGVPMAQLPWLCLVPDCSAGGPCGSPSPVLLPTVLVPIALPPSLFGSFCKNAHLSHRGRSVV